MNVTRATQRYIAEHPSIKECLRRGLINYSALAREVCGHHSITRFDAVVVACRRHFSRIKSQQSQEKKVRGLVKAAKLQMQNKMITAIIDKPRDFERVLQLQREIKRDRGDFQMIEGAEVLTLVSNSDYAERIRDEFRGRLKKLSLDLAQITMTFSEKIETTSGVVSFIYGLLADHGINVREEMSCWTDLIMLLDQADAAKAMRVLSFSQDQ